MAIFGSMLKNSAGENNTAGSWVDATRLAQKTKWLQPVTPQGIAGAAKDPVKTIENIKQGAATGASAGKSFGPYGAIIGGIAGGAAGAINSAHDQQYQPLKTGNDIGTSVKDIKDQVSKFKTYLAGEHGDVGSFGGSL
jgi:hypothetical protein